MKTVKEVIDSWDPIDLLSHAPDDEYCLEICEIEHLMTQTANIDVIGDGIYDIFTKAFGIGIFKKSRSECRRIAHSILSEQERCE